MLITSYADVPHILSLIIIYVYMLRVADLDSTETSIPSQVYFHSSVISDQVSSKLLLFYTLHSVPQPTRNDFIHAINALSKE